MPGPETERMRRTPDAPFSADSIGNVTSSSTSSGASPCASVITVTVGAVRSGKMSTGSCAVSSATGDEQHAGGGDRRPSDGAASRG